MSKEVAPPSDWNDPGQLARLAGERSPDLLVVTDPEGRLRYAGAAARRVLGLDPEHHLGDQLLDHVHPDDVLTALGGVGQAARSEGYHLPVLVRLRHADGSWVPFEVNAETLAGPGGSWLVLGLRALDRRTEIAERRVQIERLILRTSLECSRVRWYQADQVVEQMLGALARIVGADLVQLGWGETRADMVVGSMWPPPPGPTPDGPPLLSMAPLWSVAPEGEALLHVTDDLSSLPDGRDRDGLIADGFRYVVEIPLPSERVAVLRLAFRGDFTRWDDANTDMVSLLATTLMLTLRRCLVEEQLHERARRDPMTGLLNRTELYTALAGLLARPGAVGHLGVLYGDLDRFKEVNDRLGHAEGDRLVLGVAGALMANVRDGDLVARFGGDEFVVVCPDLEGPGQLHGIATRVEDAVKALAPVGVPVRMSFGSALAEPGMDADELLRRADEAMYAHKRSRGRR